MSRGKHNYRHAFICIIFCNLIFRTSGGSCVLEPNSFAASLELIRDASVRLWPKPGKNSERKHPQPSAYCVPLIVLHFKKQNKAMNRSFGHLMLPYIEMCFQRREMTCLLALERERMKPR